MFYLCLHPLPYCHPRNLGGALVHYAVLFQRHNHFMKRGEIEMETCGLAMSSIRMNNNWNCSMMAKRICL